MRKAEEQEVTYEVSVPSVLWFREPLLDALALLTEEDLPATKVVEAACAALGTIDEAPAREAMLWKALRDDPS
ncbi:MAG: hypothetical protein ACJ74O_18925 [Frankiaceae bacterium]